MVVLNRIYTRTGDDGSTALGSGERRPKSDVRIAAYGTVDEANAAIGLSRLSTATEAPDLDAMLGRIQNDLFDLGADLATPHVAGEPDGKALADRPSPGGSDRTRDRCAQCRAFAAAQFRPAGWHVGGRSLAPRSHHLPACRAPDGRVETRARRDGQRPGPQLRQPGVRFPLRSITILQSRSQRRRSLDTGCQPIGQGRRAVGARTEGDIARFEPSLVRPGRDVQRLEGLSMGQRRSEPNSG